MAADQAILVCTIDLDLIYLDQQVIFREIDDILIEIRAPVEAGQAASRARLTCVLVVESEPLLALEALGLRLIIDELAILAI